MAFEAVIQHEKQNAESIVLLHDDNYTTVMNTVLYVHMVPDSPQTMKTGYYTQKDCCA